MKQTKAQRLAAAIESRTTTYGEHREAAALLLRQDELLKQALEALEKAQHAMQADMGQDQIDEAITASRAHLGAMK